MTWSHTTVGRRTIGWAIWTIVCSCWLCAVAKAKTQTACVRCTGPDRTYRCNVMADDFVPSEAARYFCMSQIAREHVHESCAVLRGAVSCDGVDASYVYQDGVGDKSAIGTRDAPRS